MKNLLLVIFLLSAWNLSSQKKISKKKIRQHNIKVYESKNKGTILWSLDTIFNKGVPYAILKEEKKIPYSDFVLYSLTKSKLIEIRSRIGINRDKTPYYLYLFTGSEKIAEPEKYYGYKIAKEVVENQLIENDMVPSYRETEFVMKYPPRFSDTTIKVYITDDPEKDKVNKNNIYETVDRNKSSEFFFNKGKIVQDYKVIGKYKVYESLIRFYLPNGFQVAEAYVTEQETDIWYLITFKDKVTRSLNTSSEKAVEAITRYLSDNHFL